MTKVLVPTGVGDPAAEAMLAEVAEILYCFDADEMAEITPRLTLGGTPLSPERLAELRERQDKRLAELLPEVDGIYLRGLGGMINFTAEMMDQAPVLKVVGGPGSGTEWVDADAATERGIAVVNAAGGGYMPVAEHVIGLMLSLQKKIGQIDRRFHNEHKWPRTESGGFAGVNDVVDGKTMGIIGFGFVGREVAHKCLAGFNMRVLAHDPFVDPTFMRTIGVRPYARLHEMLPECDFVTLNLPLNPRTRHILGEAEIRLLKPTAYVINTSRGGTIDQAALLQALQEQRIAGAGLDVFDPEPMPDNDPISYLDNVVLTNHNAGVIHNLMELNTPATISEMVRVLRGERPWHPVNPELLYMGTARYLELAGD
jgi:phosphoglycerate dehydrogenase-like enzyme